MMRLGGGGDRIFFMWWERAAAALLEAACRISRAIVKRAPAHPCTSAKQAAAGVFRREPTTWQGGLGLACPGEHEAMLRKTRGGCKPCAASAGCRGWG